MKTFSMQTDCWHPNMYYVYEEYTDSEGGGICLVAVLYNDKQRAFDFLDWLNQREQKEEETKEVVESDVQK